MSYIDKKDIELIDTISEFSLIKKEEFSKYFINSLKNYPDKDLLLKPIKYSENEKITEENQRITELNDNMDKLIGK